MPEKKTFQTNTPGGVQTTTVDIPSVGEVFMFGPSQVAVRTQDGIKQVSGQKFLKSRGKTFQGTARSEAATVARELGYNPGDLQEYQPAFLTDALGEKNVYSGLIKDSSFDFNPFKTRKQFGVSEPLDTSTFQQSERGFNQQEKDQIFGGREMNFRPQDQVNTSTPSETTLQVAKANNPIGFPNQTPDFGRKLGPTEFGNLRREWTKNFNDKGIFDINVINDAIEKNFLNRNGIDIHLKNSTPSIDKVIADTKIVQRNGQSYNKTMSGVRDTTPVDASTISENVANINVELGSVLPETVDFTQNKANLADFALTDTQKSLMGIRDQLKNINLKEQEALNNEINSLTGKITSLSLTSSRDLIEQELKKVGLEKLESELTEIEKEINKEKLALNLGLQNEGNRVAPMTLIGRAQKALQDQALARLGFLTAEAERVQGNINGATQKASMFIDALNQDKERQISLYSKFLTLNNDKLIKLEAEEKDFIKDQLNDLEKQIAKTEKNKNFIIDLMTNSDTAEVAREAGITLIDTPEQAAMKMSPILAEKAKTERLAELQDEEGNRLLTLKEAEQYGVPFGTRTIDLQGIVPSKILNNTKPPTSEQYKVAGFLSRMSQAEDVYNSIENQILSMSTAEFIKQKALPNFSKSTEMQQLEQAQRNFITAVLRRESGAAISDTEFKTYTELYFPQPGDSDAVLQQKKQSRDLVRQSFASEAGNAYTEPTPDFNALKSNLNPLRQSYNSLEDLVSDNPAYLGYIESVSKYLRKQEPSISEYDILEIIQSPGGFKADLSMSVNGFDLDKVAQAIGEFESGGNYNARGPVVPTGRYSGERAMGMYQIMPGNLPQWSREALGYEISESQFMSNPTLQDKIAKHQFKKNLEKYGTIDDVASVWFTGQPLSQGGNKRDVIGTSGNTYARNVKAIYQRLV